MVHPSSIITWKFGAGYTNQLRSLATLQLFVPEIVSKARETS